MIAAAAFALGLLATPALAQSARLDPADWSISSASPTGTNDPAAAIDGDAATAFRSYTPRRNSHEAFPIDLVVDLGQDTLVDGFEYLSMSGRAFLESNVKSYEIALQPSNSEEWTTVATGQFPDAPGDAQKVEFESAAGGKVRLRINSSHNGFWTNVAEIGVFSQPEPEPEVCGLLRQSCCEGAGADFCYDARYLACKDNICQGCGSEDHPCCADAVCDQSRRYSLNVCNEDNICRSCGYLGEPCCEGEYLCLTPGGKYCDDANICQSCGNSAGEPCCPNKNCTFRRGPGAPSLICDNDNTCQDCGGLNQPCCEGAECNNSGLLCDNSNKCDFCGDTGQPCCEGDFCNNGDNLCHAHEGNQKVCDEG